jgi:transcriptional regulator with XRE-family HTH domain
MQHLPDPIDVEVGARIREHRRLLSISQTKLAVAVGVTFQQVQKYERGANRVSTSMLVHIAHELGTTVGALVGEHEATEARPRAEVFRVLGMSGASDLLKAYAAIPDAAVRQAVLKLAKVLAAG